MANKKGDGRSKIRSHRQKMVFAEDLVNYILQINSLPAMRFSSEREKKNCVFIFGNDLEVSADFLISADAPKFDKAYRYIINNNMNNVPSFNYYAQVLKTKFIRNDRYTEYFFHYSVHLAYLAAKLYAQGFKEALRMVVHFITEAMDLELFSSRRALLQRIAQIYAVNQRKLIATIEQASPQNTNGTSVKAIAVQAGILHERLSQPKGTSEIVRRDEYAGGEVSKCGEDQHQVINKKAFNIGNMRKSTAAISSFSSFQSPSEFRNMRTFRFEDPNTIPDTMFSSCSIGVPGSYRGQPTNLRSQECYSADNVLPACSIGVPGSSRGDRTNLHSQECYSADSSKDENRQGKKPRIDRNS